MGRSDVKLALKEILEDMDIFYKIYMEPTDIEKEKSFPIAWITLGSESIGDGDLSVTCYMRNVSLEITVGSKHTSTSSMDMDELLDRVFETIKSNYTLNGTIINLAPLSIITDRGYYHPYSLASLMFTLQIR
jgi:hypothetical protein